MNSGLLMNILTITMRRKKRRRIGRLKKRVIGHSVIDSIIKLLRRRHGNAAVNLLLVVPDIEKTIRSRAIVRGRALAVLAPDFLWRLLFQKAAALLERRDRKRRLDSGDLVLILASNLRV
jgi:hypothetical protein